jgi:hypothetical protein
LNEYSIDLTDLRALASPAVRYCRVLANAMSYSGYVSHAEVVVAFFVSPEGADVWKSGSWMSDEIMSYIIPNYEYVKYDWLAERHALRDHLTFEKIREVAEKYNLDIYTCYDGYELSHVLVLMVRHDE